MNTITFANLTPESFMSLLRKAVDKRGADYVYPDSHRYADNFCRYRYKGRPSCIIGEVVHAIDPTVKLQEKTSASDVLSINGVMNSDILEAADNAQSTQDDSLTWGEAYDDAAYYLNLPYYNG